LQTTFPEVSLEPREERTTFYNRLFLFLSVFFPSPSLYRSLSLSLSISLSFSFFVVSLITPFLNKKFEVQKVAQSTC
jgi:hypothetical protein